MKELSVGGQAVIEGVMMKGKRTIVAVRAPDGSIVSKRIEGAVKNTALFSVHFIRGGVALYEALIIGSKATSISAEITGEGEMTCRDTILTFGVAFAIATGLFCFYTSVIDSAHYSKKFGRFVRSY